MPAITSTITMSVSSNRSTPLSGTVTDTGNDIFVTDVVLDSPTFDTPVSCSFLTANLRQLYMICEADATVHMTWSGGTQDFDLTGGSPYVWSAQAGLGSNPVLHNITGLLVGCPEGGRFQLQVLVV